MEKSSRRGFLKFMGAAGAAAVAPFHFKWERPKQPPPEEYQNELQPMEEKPNILQTSKIKIEIDGKDYTGFCQSMDVNSSTQSIDITTIDDIGKGFRQYIPGTRQCGIKLVFEGALEFVPNTRHSVKIWMDEFTSVEGSFYVSDSYIECESLMMPIITKTEFSLLGPMSVMSMDNAE